MALLLWKRSFHFYLYLFISRRAVHGVVNHESYGRAPHNTADVDENGCGYPADDSVVCVSAVPESVSGTTAAIRAVNALRLIEEQIKTSESELRDSKRKLKEQALSVWIIAGFLSARAVNWALRARRDLGFIFSSIFHFQHMHSVVALLLLRGHGHTQLFKKACQAILNACMNFEKMLFSVPEWIQKENFFSLNFVQYQIHEKMS